MRIAIVNDDMPFLVDSVANAVAARQLTIHRLLHPVVCVDRDEDGELERVEPLCGDKSRRESMMYLELDRADARGRQELAADLRRVLGDVRLAVRDWEALQRRMRDGRDAAIEDPEGAALLNWFADGAMTLLGYHVEKPYEAAVGRARHLQHPRRADRRGRLPRRDALFRAGRRSAADGQGRAASRRSTAASRSISSSFRCKEGDKVIGIGVHAGLWTSEALRVPPEEVPVLRARLKQLDKDFGFDPKGHSGKALRHSVASLPRDLVIAIDYDALRELVMIAMSLADRPRPALLQVRSDPQGPAVHLRLASARGAEHGAPDGDRAGCSKTRSGARSPAGRSSSATPTSRSSATPNISTRRRRSPMPRRSTPPSSRWSAAGLPRSRPS